MAKEKVKQAIQRFGGAMFTPVLLFAVFGIIVGISTLFKNELVMGSIAAPTTTWFKIWDVINVGANTVFKQMPILFVIGLPVSLAKKQSARAVMEAVVIYFIFIYFVSTILQYWGNSFGVDFESTERTSGLASIAGIRTLDMGVFGSILISGIAVWLHNKFFDLELPKMIETFKGSPTVVLIGFILMLPVAILACLIWPKVQYVISLTQQVIINSGVFGVWFYTLLERMLIPTGLHHFVYAPFLYDSAVVAGGIKAAWVENLPTIAQSTESLRTLFPEGGYALTGMSKMFAPLGIGAAFYVTAKEEKKKIVLGLLIPIIITAAFTGITEPIEFTFLFISPLLFLVHGLLAATMSAITYMFGISGDFSLGLIQNAALNWLPLFKTHGGSYIIQIIIGLVFSGIYFVVFRYLILKFDFKTPGREAEDVAFISKAEYNKSRQGESETGDKYAVAALHYLEGLGGIENIIDVTNCATRLRVSVKDEQIVLDDSFFKAMGAYGVVRNGTSFQVIIGADVISIREAFEKLIRGEEHAKI